MASIARNTVVRVEETLEPQLLSAFPRVSIAHAPTPFEFLERLSARLGGPAIWVKRDDCTGLAGGGNKVRKLEFLIGAALESGADTVITAGAIQSNHARQTAAAAARLNLRSILVLTDTVGCRGPAYRNNGNLLIDRLLGADIHLVGGDVDTESVLESIADRERERGRSPFVIPVGGSNAPGVLGYVAGFFELHAQIQEQATAFDAIVLPTGSGGTQAGLVLGAAFSGWCGDIIGISVGASAERQRMKIAKSLRSAAALLGIEDSDSNRADILVDDRFVGPGYGEPASETIEAIRIAAETEGLLLDPVYSGKAMAGLIALIRAGRFRRDQNAVFLHTGGAQALSAYPEHFI
jgi:D-cysteine desulfhydrase/L-cysteate sulfo-lyase